MWEKERKTVIVRERKKKKGQRATKKDIMFFSINLVYQKIFPYKIFSYKERDQDKVRLFGERKKESKKGRKKNDEWKLKGNKYNKKQR